MRIREWVTEKRGEGRGLAHMREYESGIWKNVEHLKLIGYFWC